MTDVRRAGSPLWIAYETVAMLVGLGTLALICLAWLPFALLLHPLLPRRLGQPLGRRAIAVGFRLYLRILELCCACRFDLKALDALRDQGPLIVAANHPSLLDAVMITSRLPNAVCVMKASLMDNILFGSAARLARYIRNDAALKMILDGRDALSQGAHLVIFPEGTRTTDFPLDPCMPTAGLIASRAKVPVQTLLIEFDALSRQGVAAVPPAGTAADLPHPARPPLSAADRHPGLHGRTRRLLPFRNWPKFGTDRSIYRLNPVLPCLPLRIPTSS